MREKGNKSVTVDPNHLGSYIVKINVKTNSKRNRIYQDGEMLRVDINSPPVKGKANNSIIKLLSKTIGISKSSISIIRGHTSHTKIFLIKAPDMTIQQVIDKLDLEN
ncbi:DUF167 domain-containing protein [Promethearchaeum syntrophicum]|uniref:UPF0235 protein DSAG12_00989 n=1 Tax=Promethearchaeum syntrophicum TaxID=2594042 RepID=A0A5B9D811_9ARCH|nr:DUF167 domain-containing protein [Candidatus Prometheoarchaeum syntrophicum]QEE15165.1 hypothetical protein DSAG12_00989 [Candidatus Prometheoarchaeum syntrophicum]